MLNNLGLGLVFTAHDLASGHVARLERNFLSLEDSVTGGGDRIRAAFKQLGTGASIFFAGVATLAGAFALTSKAAEFEQAIAVVGAVSEASKEDVEALENAALRMGIETQYAPTEATKGLEELAQAGFNARQSIALLRPVLDLAAGSLGKLTPESAAGVAVQALRAFRIPADDAAEAVDHMLKAANVFSMNAGELPLALGHAADGANVLQQSLEETLTTFGLVHNIVPGVERAATAVSVAMERMADPRTQQMLQGLGVATADATGKFLPFLDIIKQLAPRLDAMTQKDRAAFLLKAFGHHALAGIGDILTQLSGGVTTTTGAILRGAEAVDYLRGQIQSATGAASKFSGALLNTLAGQEKLLHGSIETLEIILGKSFAQVFRPIVEGVLGALNAVLEVIQATPKPIKRVLATLAVGVGAFLTLVGGVLAAKGAIAILAMGLEILGVSLGAIAETIGVAVAAVAVLGVVVAGLKVAWDKNLGGIADRVQRVGEIIRLFFQGVSQLIEQGGFSGALREELNKAENAGLKEFLVQVWMTWYRLEKFWTGLKEGFTGVLEAAWPVFQDLSEAFDDLATEIAMILGGITGSAAALPSEQFRDFGRSVGEALAWIAEKGAQLLAGVLRLGSGLVSGTRESFGWISTATRELGDALGLLGDAWRELTGANKDSSAAMEASTDGLKTVGRVIVDVLGGALAAVIWLFAGLADVIRWVIVIATKLKNFFVGVADFVTDLGNAIVWFFTEALPDALSAGAGAIGRILGTTGDAIASMFGLRPDGETSHGSAGASGVAVPLPQNTRMLLGMAPPSASMPAAMSVRGGAEQSASLESLLAATRAAPPPPAPPVTVNLKVDGETLASVQTKAVTDVATRSFSPVPVY
jgi:TP901 family phage tail tape measure protein